MTVRTGLLLVVLLAAIALAAVGLVKGLRQSRPRYARILVLDAHSGKTLHGYDARGGYAVAALLRDGRVAVAAMDDCIDGGGGSIVVLDAALEHAKLISSPSGCAVARMNPGDVRAVVEPRRAPAEDGLAGGVIDQLASSQLSARDAAGKTLWKRAFGRALGVIDTRDGRTVVPELGRFAPGSD
jgi:hypothetical protein